MPVNDTDSREDRPFHVNGFVCVPFGPVSRKVMVAPTPPTVRTGLAPRSRLTVVVAVAPSAVSAGCEALMVRAAALGRPQLYAGALESLAVPTVPSGLTPCTWKHSARPSS